MVRSRVQLSVKMIPSGKCPLTAMRAIVRGQIKKAAHDCNVFVNNLDAVVDSYICDSLKKEGFI